MFNFIFYIALKLLILAVQELNDLVSDTVWSTLAPFSLTPSKLRPRGVIGYSNLVLTNLYVSNTVASQSR